MPLPPWIVIAGPTVRVELLLAFVVAILITAAFAGRLRLAAFLGLAVLLVGAPNVVPFESWLRDDRQTQTTDLAWARYGQRVRDATAPDARIAAASVGNVGYFSNRPMVDLLGKTDPVIARRPARTDFWMLPGHIRWDYRYSIGTLRPDIVAELFQPTRRDRELVESEGYLLVPTENPRAPSFVREDTTRVERDLNERAARAAP